MTPRLENLTRLLTRELGELAAAEVRLGEALEALAETVHDDELREALREHRQDSQEHLSRLERILSELGADRGGSSAIADALATAALEIARAPGSPDVHDAAVIIAVQKIEHYEIAAYGSVRTLANVLGHIAAAEALQMSLDDESAMDDRLSDLAESINVDATIPGSEADVS